MKKRRGQLLAQPLFYLLAVVVGAMILFFGYKIISGTVSSTQPVLIQKWSMNLDKTTEQLFYQDTGSTRPFTIQLPSLITHVCIKSGTISNAPAYLSQTDKVLMNAHTEKNVFFIPVDAYASSTAVTIDNLQGKNSLDCFQNGRTIILESKGTYVEAHE